MARSKRRRLLGLVLIAAYFAAAYSLLSYFGITCVFLELFGIPCPGCGMTRAFRALVRLDFLQAARYNVMIFFMPYVAAYVLFDFRHKAHTVLLKVIAGIAIINWIIKLLSV
ncbi:MAG: DUF2752 domain-containing protein [Oscillospiraceae bacterium]|nr:DUF2752 domain-containing protein [Oscillospiraceae bacterium]